VEEAIIKEAIRDLEFRPYEELPYESYKFVYDKTFNSK
jgi:hypothetical protein